MLAVVVIGTCAVLAVVLVELDKDGGGHHQEVSQGGGGGVCNHREPLTQAAQTLENTHTQITYNYTN